MSFSSGVSSGVSALITRIKGSDYEVDPDIPGGYLLGVMGDRSLMRARGLARFRSANAPFMGAGASIRGRASFSNESGCTLGPNSYVDAMSRNGVRFGRNVSLGRNSRIECIGSLRHLGEGMSVGDDVGLGTDCFYGCAGGITIGSSVMVGNLVTMHSENHVSADTTVPMRDQGVTHRGIVIEDDCWIGAKATILDGVHLGRGSVVAAGSVVTAGDYPAYGIYGGVPARLLRSRSTTEAAGV